MVDAAAGAAFAELLGEIKLLRADLAWIKKSADTNADLVAHIDARLRSVESDTAAIKAAQRPVVSWPAIVTIVISALVAAGILLDRVYGGA